MNVFSTLLTVVTSKHTVRTVVGLLVLVGVWFLCGALGWQGTRRWLVMAGALLLVAAVQILLGLRSRRRHDKAAADLETSMVMEADQSVAGAGAGEKQAREEARRELLAAIDVLKRSQLADGRSGKAALYVLPWYLVLGSGYAGKSSLIRNSGLQPPDKGPGELRGIGASTNCEWWFTNHAVLLEADRRFVASAGAKAAERDWETFLDTLRRQRPRISLNGVVITISAADLLQSPAGELEAQAKLLRRRLDAIAEQLKLVFPVYLMVTKLDLVQGFVDFFGGVEGVAAEQIFGCTLRAAQMQAAQVERDLAAEFELLYQTLDRRRQIRLVQTEYHRQREGTFLFPLEFRALCGALQRFAQVLCEPNAYGRNPLVRGAYFASVGGEGTTADRVLPEMARVLGLPAPSARNVTPGSPLFLHGFFRKVLVPDCDMARPTRGAARRLRTIRRVAQVAVLAALVAFAAALAHSYGRNRDLVRHTGELARAAATVVPSADTRLPGLNDTLPLLDDLRRQLETLDRTDEGPSPAWSLGMYRGDQVNQAARQVYLDRFATIVVRPYVVELANWLRRTRPDGDQFDEFYRRYQVYRLLVAPTSGDTTLVVPVLQQLMVETAGSRSVLPPQQERLAAHVHYALRHAPELENLVRGRERLDQDILDTAGAYIADHWQIEVYYRKVLASIDARRSDLAFNLASLGAGDGLLVYREDPTTEILRDIPASFTRRGWDEEVSKVLGSTEHLIKDSKLLPQGSEQDPAQRHGQLLRLYADDYLLHWRRFLNAVTLASPNSLNAAVRQLNGLQAEDSSYRRLIAEATRNLTFALDDKAFKLEVVNAMNGITTAFGALQLAQRPAKEDKNKQPLDDFLATVKALQEALAALNTGDHQQAAAGFTGDIFAKSQDRESVIYLSVKQADQMCDGVGVPGNPDCNQAFRALLRQPALAAWQACLRETEDYLDAKWVREVVEPSSTVTGRYPLAAGGTDAGLDEFGRFFHEGGVLQSFVKNHLEAYLEFPGYVPRQIHGQGLNLTAAARESLNRSARLRRVMFAGGGATPRVSFKVRPSQARVAGQDGLHVESTVFAVGPEKLEYRQGTPAYKTFDWPQDRDTNSARVSAKLMGGDGWQTVDGDDSAWALFRLIAKAEDSAAASPSFRLTWKIPLAGRPGSIVAPYDFSMDSSEHAFVSGLFDYSCPVKLFR